MKGEVGDIEFGAEGVGASQSGGFFSLVTLQVFLKLIFVNVPFFAVTVIL